MSEQLPGTSPLPSARADPGPRPATAADELHVLCDLGVPSERAGGQTSSRAFVVFGGSGCGFSVTGADGSTLELDPRVSLASAAAAAAATATATAAVAAACARAVNNRGENRLSMDKWPDPARDPVPPFRFDQRRRRQ